jgi:signal transduction histidine kinase
LRALVRPQQLTLQPTDLALLAAEVLRREAPLYSERHIKVESDFSTLLPLVMANSEEMTQVLLNLYKNAVEAMPAGGTLTVRGFRAGTQPCLEVSDTGEGIPEGVDILEPFVTTKSGGTGLGLAIVQQIIAAHGGSMSYTSIRGRGTTFTLTLPISPGDAR